jgi:hypothetical protein
MGRKEISKYSVKGQLWSEREREREREREVTCWSVASVSV